ncbi:pentapeptide repeat-containing protein, partial [Magnetospirillum sulfuroxidans]
MSPALSESAPDLAQRVSAINDVAKTVRTLLASMAAVAVAMAATMIAATDEAIFRDSAKVFPSLSVEIRLSTAFALAPPIFVFLHLNALLQLHLLTRRLRAFLALTEERPHTEQSRDAWQRQVHGLSFVQMLLPDRQGGISRLLQAVASWISVVGLPVLLLLAVQVGFVRYQSWAITIIHMACLGADMALLMWFQLSLWPDYWKRLTALGAPGLLAVVGIMTQAVPPEMGSDITNLFDAHISHIQGFAWTRRTLSLRGAMLINTDAKPDLLKPLSADDTTLHTTQIKMLRLSIPDRNFVGIDLTEAELFAIDMENSNLQYARLSGAQMRGSNLFTARMQGSQLSGAHMQGADLGEAEMEQADLSGAQLQGAELHDAQMQGADLSGAQMQGASLHGAYMQGADLTGCGKRRVRAPFPRRSEAFSGVDEGY